MAMGLLSIAPGMGVHATIMAVHIIAVFMIIAGGAFAPAQPYHAAVVLTVRRRA